MKEINIEIDADCLKVLGFIALCIVGGLLVGNIYAFFIPLLIGLVGATLVGLTASLPQLTSFAGASALLLVLQMV